MKRWLKWMGNTLAVAFFLVCFIGTGQMWLFQGPFLLALGWVFFLGRVLPEVTFRWDAIAETVGVVAVLGGGLHLFLRRMWRQVRPEDPSPWPARWTGSLLGLIVLLFCATMATVGVGHQVGWLFSKQEPWLVSTWGLRNERVSEGGRELCAQAMRILETDPSGASLSRALLDERETRRAAENMHIVLVRGAGGSRRLVVFSRDPQVRERDGVLSCGQGPRELHPAGNLPKLLVGEAVAGGKEL